MAAPDMIKGNRPTVGTLVVAFATALLGWALEAVPATVPTEVVATGYVLAAAAVAVAVGKAAQGQIGKRWLEDEAPWAHDTHAAAVAYALSLDVDEHGDELEILLHRLGVGSSQDAAALIGLNQDGDR